MRRHYLGIWAIITVALIIIVAISFADPFSIFGYEVKKTPIAEVLTATDTEADAVSANNDSTAIASKFPAPLDTTSQNILIIGDSMLEGLNPRLAAYAKANGHRDMVQLVVRILGNVRHPSGISQALQTYVYIHKPRWQRAFRS